MPVSQSRAHHPLLQVGEQASMRKRLCCLFVACLVLSCSVCRASQGVSKPVQALCSGHETVFGVTTGLFPGLKALELSPDEQVNMSRLPYVELLNALRSLGPRALSEFFQSSETIVGAADEFTSPTGDFGLAGYRAVYIGTASVEASSKAGNLFRAASNRDVNGLTIWSWTEINDTHARGLTFFGTRVLSATLISTSEAQLVETARQLQASNLASCASGWNEFTSQPYWIYRQCQKGRTVPIDTLKELDGQATAIWLTLSNQVDGEICLYGKLKLANNASESSSANQLHFGARGPGFSAHIEGKVQRVPGFWAGILGSFGFELFV